MTLIDFSTEHAQAFLALNQHFVHWLSPLDGNRLDYLLTRASHARCMVDGGGHLLGALIAYRHDVDYPDHWNMAWLREHLEGFVYIDRIIVADAAQGRGVARALYTDLERFAVSQGITTLACEINTQPDNPASHAFHQRLGFRPIGDRTYPDGRSSVRYYAKPLEPR